MSEEDQVAEIVAELCALAGHAPFYDPRIGRYYALRLLEDGRELAVVPLTYGRARLTVGPAGATNYDDGW